MKIYQKNKLNNAQKKRSVSREITLLKNMNHPNVVRLYDSVETQQTINLFLEHCQGRSLYTFLKLKPYRRVSENTAKKIFKQIVDGMAYVHSQNIAHRDLKPDNILIQELPPSISSSSSIKVKIIDFGFSICQNGKNKLRTFCGTPSYMAPEIVAKRDYDGKQADVWALGIILYAMIYGRCPFRGVNEKELYQRIQKGIFKFPDEIHAQNLEEYKSLNISSECKNLISRVLVSNASKRPTAEQIQKDVWFN